LIHESDKKNEEWGMKNDNNGLEDRAKMTSKLYGNFRAVAIVIGAVVVGLPLFAPDNSFAAGDLSSRLFGRTYPVTQGYLNRSSLNPTPGGLHAGIDYGAPAGTVVRAIRSGQVLTAGNSYGTVSVFDGQNTVIYLHLRKIDVRVGQRIEEGKTQIGEVGGVGVPGGRAHLHLEVRRGRQPLAVYVTSGKSTADLTLDPSRYL
jgi:murein DD-endopeptidase MepM/ murein hydrolase activator NlpD